MGYPRRERCAKRDHSWKPMKRGGAHEQCTKCGDVFPCRSACDHLDCIVATGREIPALFGEDPTQAREAMLAELAIIAPTVYAAAIGMPKRKHKSTTSVNRVKTVNGLTRDQLEAQLASAIERKAWHAEDAIRAHLRLFENSK